MQSVYWQYEAYLQAFQMKNTKIFSLKISKKKYLKKSFEKPVLREL